MPPPPDLVTTTGSTAAPPPDLVVELMPRKPGPVAKESRLQPGNTNGRQVRERERGVARNGEREPRGEIEKSVV